MRHRRPVELDGVGGHRPGRRDELGPAPLRVGTNNGDGGLVADACRKTIRTLVKNSIENVENQILSVLEEVRNLLKCYQ